MSRQSRRLRKEYKLTGGREFTSVCHFCGCGCGTIGYVKDGKLINLEGAADNPVNRGGLCPKGIGYGHIPNAELRPKCPLYRAPGSDHWEEISWGGGHRPLRTCHEEGT